MKQGVLLSTTEHLLAAIYSCGIDNIYIDIDSIEVPILDGSAEPFMQMLKHSGVRKLRRKRRYLKILKRWKLPKETAGSASILPMSFACAATWIFRTRWSANKKWRCWLGRILSATFWLGRVLSASSAT